MTTDNRLVKYNSAIKGTTWLRQLQHSLDSLLPQFYAGSNAVNKIIRILVCSLFFSFGWAGADPMPVITESLINEVNDTISKATAECDFDKSTNYYFEQTKFFNYSHANGVKDVQQQNYVEALAAIKEYMSACLVTLEKEQPIVEKVSISEDKQQAIFSYEAIHYLKSKDNRRFKSHSEGKTMFAIVDGAIKITETHYTPLSFSEIEAID